MAVLPAMSLSLAASLLASLPLAAPRAALGAAPSAGAAPLEELTNELIHSGALDGLPPSAFAWAPGGARLAFLRKTAPDKDPLLHLYDADSRRTVALTSHEEGPRKLAVSSFSWSPRGDALLAEAGGDLHLIGLEGGAPAAPRRLTRTEAAEKDAKLSPDGTMAGFVRDHDLVVLDLASGAERRLTSGGGKDLLNGEVDWVYEEEFDLSSAWWWSPDSSRIAYLQFDESGVPTYPIVDWIPIHPVVEMQHYPKAGDPNPAVRLGVVAARGGAGEGPPPTRWIDLGAPADAYLPRVAWTASGRSLAAQRLDRDQRHLELLLCDPDSGKARKVLEERDERWVNIDHDWKFLGAGAPGLPSGGFVWGSERDGYRHLYLHAEDGRRIRRLTRGPWMVTSLQASDTKTGWVHLTATERSPLERHLYRVRLDGSGFERLTREEGWHTTWVAPETGAFVDSHSTAMTPAAIAVRRADGSIADWLDEGMGKELARYRRGRVEFRTAPADDGTRLPAAITLPPDFDPSRKHPVLVYVYGGPHSQTVTNQWGGARGLWHQMMAARGVIVWSLDNRGMWGRGHAWESPIFRRMGRQELADQLAGVAYLRSLPYVDGSRVAIWGWSYGGYMTLYALLNSPDTFRAGVAVAPVTDWRDYDTIYTERYMDRPSDNESGYEESAPLKKADRLKTPLLLAHGSSDDNVHMQHSVQILDAFVTAGRPVEFMLYPRKNHGITGAEARAHIYEKIARFLLDSLTKTGGDP